MKKKSFIVHEEATNEEVLIASATFCYAVVVDGVTQICVGDGFCSVRETIQEVQSLYEETEG